MEQGQLLSIGESWESGVYRRVMEKLPVVEQIYNAPKSWEEKELEHHTMVALRELALEQVRRERFPQYPSRLHCLYVSESLEESRQWGMFLPAGPPHLPYREARDFRQKICGERKPVFSGDPEPGAELGACRKILAGVPRPFRGTACLGDPGGRESLCNGNRGRDRKKPGSGLSIDTYKQSERSE